MRRTQSKSKNRKGVKGAFGSCKNTPEKYTKSLVQQVVRLQNKYPEMEKLVLPSESNTIRLSDEDLEQ